MWTLADQSDVVAGGVELENDSGGLRWTFYLRHGIQKVRGSNPLGSTKFLNTRSPPFAGLRASPAALDTLFDTLSDTQSIGDSNRQGHVGGEGQNSHICRRLVLVSARDKRPILLGPQPQTVALDWTLLRRAVWLPRQHHRLPGLDWQLAQAAA